MIRVRCKCGTEMESELWKVHDDGVDVAFCCSSCGAVLQGIVIDDVEIEGDEELPESCDEVRGQFDNDDCLVLAVNC